MDLIGDMQIELKELWQIAMCTDDQRIKAGLINEYHLRFREYKRQLQFLTALDANESGINAPDKTRDSYSEC
jgi:hypothetical protein